MACYHLHVDQIKRSEGRSSVACAAYRSGEHLFDDYYGEHKDYTRKGGVILREIHLPPHAPQRFLNREILWNEVEWTEKNKKAQLAHSYDIALMNEFTMDENIAIVRRFVEEQFVSRGMIADVCIHAPEKNGGIPNPHFHVMIPIRPLNPDGAWGIKEKKIPVLDEDGNPVFGENGKPKMKAVPTTDWSSKETLLAIRKAWEDINNELYERKNLPMRIDCRSYEERGIDKIPTLHEGPAVRKMEARGIETNIGKLNRLIRATNEMMEHLAGVMQWLRDKIQLLTDVIEEYKQPTLADYLRYYYDERNRVAETFAYGTKKAQMNNFHDYVDVVNYLMANKIYTPDDLKEVLEDYEARFNKVKDKIKAKRAEIDAIRKYQRDLERYKVLKPIETEYTSKHIPFLKKKYFEEHKKELKQFYALKKEMDSLRNADGKIPVVQWQRTLDQLEADVEKLNEEKEALYPELKMLRKIQKIVDFTLEPQIDVAAGNSGSPDSRDQGDKDNGSSIHKRIAENKEKVTNTPKKNNHRQERDSL